VKRAVQYTMYLMSDRRYIVYCTALFTKCTTWRWHFQKPKHV